MRVQKVQLKNFLSVKDSGEVKIDEKITVLIGINESGKTNFLKALESFDPDYEYTEEDFCNYSDVREKLDRKELEPKDIEMVKIWLKTEEEDIKKLKKIHQELAKTKHLEITKYFNNQYKVESPDYKIENMRTRRAKILEGIVEKISSQVGSLATKLEQHMQRHAPFASSKPQFDQCVEKFLSTDFTNLSNVVPAFSELYTCLRALPNMDAQISSDVENAIKMLEQLKNGLMNKLKEKDIAEKILDLVPNFIYFSSIDLLMDSVKIDGFLKNRSKYKTFDNLTNLAGLDVKTLKKMSLYRRRLITDVASTRITGMVNESWTQEKVGVRIGINGEHLAVFVEDETGALADPPSKRSDGFQWFLSFYINFMAGSKGEFRNTVLLLDNPGLLLHASGQRDLLRTLEKISESNQIIFTTHSPFLIDRKHLSRVRIVLKKGYRIGTTIEEKFHHSNYDALEPIRAAIGMSLGDALFGTKNNLIVEGYPDYLILEAMSNFCKRIRENYLHSKISVIAVGGADKVPFYALYFGKENLNYAVLLDNDPKGRKVAKDLVEDYYVEEKNIIKLNDIAPEERRGMDVEIEDLIDSSFYNKAVNEAYKEILERKGKEEIKIQDLETSIIKQTKKYEKYFRKNKLGTFNKVIAAKQIYNITSDKLCTKEVVGEKTIKNFDKLFQIINAKLL